MVKISFSYHEILINSLFFTISTRQMTLFHHKYGLKIYDIILKKTHFLEKKLNFFPKKIVNGHFKSKKCQKRSILSASSQPTLPLAILILHHPFVFSKTLTLAPSCSTKRSTLASLGELFTVTVGQSKWLDLGFLKLASIGQQRPPTSQKP